MDDICLDLFRFMPCIWVDWSGDRVTSWGSAAHRMPPGSFALRESEASAANVLSARKRSVSGKCFICAKAKRQRQSAQSERKSTTRYGDELKNTNLTLYGCLKKVFIAKYRIEHEITLGG